MNHFMFVSAHGLTWFHFVSYAVHMNAKQAETIRTGATVKALREAHGWRLGKFATAIEISHPYLANIEAGRKPLTKELARRIADKLGVPLAAITTEYSIEEIV